MLHGPVPVLSFTAAEKLTWTPSGRAVTVVSPVGVGSSLTMVLPPSSEWRHSHVRATDFLPDGAGNWATFALRCAMPWPTSSVTHAEVLQRAEAGTLAPDPVFAEWLVLLGKGDLLAH